MKSNKLKEILKYLEMFGISMLLLLFTTVAIVKITLLNRNFVSLQFNDEHYKNVEESLKTAMKQSMISSGIDDSIINDMFDTSDIKNSTNQILNIIYTHNSIKFDTTSIENKLRENIKKDFEKKNFSLDNEEGYNEFVDSIMEIYRGEFIMLNQVSKVGKLVSMITKPVLIATIGLGVLLVLILIIRRKKLYRILPIALLTSSFLILFGTIYIYSKAGLANTTIISVTFSDIIRKIIKSTFNIYQITSIIYIIIAVIIVIVSKVRIKRKHHHNH